MIGRELTGLNMNACGVASGGAFRTAILMAALLSLGACATSQMSEEACATADWASLGYNDGRDGERLARLAEREAQCATFGFGVDSRAYMSGRRDGLDQFCTDDRGFDYAMSGNVYKGVCSPQREQDFLAGFVSGLRIRGFEDGVAQVQQNISAASEQMNLRDRDLQAERALLDDPDLTDDQRRDIRRRIRNARDAIALAQSDYEASLYELGRAEEARDQAAATIDSYQQTPEFQVQVEELVASHELARALDAIDYCADSQAGTMCYVRSGARVKDDVTSDVCLMGPGILRVSPLREGIYSEFTVPEGDPSARPAFVLDYTFFAYRIGRDGLPTNRPENRSSGGFEAAYTDNPTGLAAVRCFPSGSIQP